MAHWQIKATHEVLNHPRMHLVEDDVILPDGRASKYLRMIDKPDYVTVIALTEGKIVMVHDYSYPNDQLLLQFPEGLIDEGESPEQAANRELSEEAGYQAGEMQEIGTNLDNARRSTARDRIYVADNLNKVETARESEEIGMTVELLTEQEITEKIAAGEIIQKNALAAWAHYLSWTRQR